MKHTGNFLSRWATVILWRTTPRDCVLEGFFCIWLTFTQKMSGSQLTVDVLRFSSCLPTFWATCTSYFYLPTFCLVPHLQFAQHTLVVVHLFSAATNKSEQCSVIPGFRSGRHAARIFKLYPSSGSECHNTTFFRGHILRFFRLCKCSCFQNRWLC